MSFYSSQVGKKSSRYCDSSLYGNNLSSVYADGPPPLDDSTQDEDDDEMVFKSTNREKSPNRQENTDKTTKDLDAQPWPNSSQNADNSSANDDFGDFSSFADFSSAFGGTKDTTTESQSTWFGTNGDHCHSTGISLKKSNQEVKATTYSDDDEFGCFSGGDESDIENYKTFPEKPQTNSDLKSENVSNGISHNLVTQQSDSSTQHGINQSNVLQTDLFSDDDDDDDEMNDFESPYPGKTGIACPPKNSINDDEPMSPLSVDIPPILSDDNDEDDDGFGDFSSSNFSTSNYGSNTIPNTTVYQKSPRFQISPKCESNAQQDTKSIEKRENLPKTSTRDGQHKDVSYDSISEEQKSSNKQVDFVDQKSINSISQQGSSNIDDSDEFGDFNTHFGSNEEDMGDESSAASNDAGLQSSNCQSNPSEILEKRNTSKNNEHKGDDFRTVAQSQNEESHDSRKLASSLSQDDEADDFGDFSTVSDEKHKNNTLDGNNGDDFGNFTSTDTNNALFERTATSATPNTQNLGDSSNNLNSANESKSLNSSSKSITNESSNNSNHSFFKESESKSQLFKENKTSTFSNDSSATIKEHDVEFESFSEVTEPTQCNQDSNFAQFSASHADSIKTTDKDGNNDDDDFGDFGSVQNIKSASAKSEDNDFSDFNQPSSNSPGDDDDFGEFGHAADDEFGDFSQSASNKQTKDDDDDCGNFGKPVSSASKDGDDDDFGDFGQPSTDDSFGDFEQPSKPDTSFGKFGQSSTTKLKSGDSDFGKPSSMKPENDNDDFGDFGKPSSMTPENDNDDGFGDFSKGSSTTNTGIADCKTSSDSGLPNTKSSDMFSRSEAGNLSSQSFRSQSPVTMATSKDIQHTVASTKASSIFQPQKTPSITVINNLIKQSFVAVQSNIQDSVIAVLLEHELNSGKPSVWGAIKGAGRDGSLRFQWMDSDHKLKMLEALCMLPVRVQTSASFKSSGPVRTPLFASGLGLLEPTKGVITPFHHGVEEIDPSQDPFGAPPEVGIPDLGFGSKGNGSKKDTMPGHLDTRDSSDTISVSSSLDLDFLAPASSTGDLTKPEGKALFEDDLLGLGMQFSATNESPTVFNSSKDQKKIFKFNTSTVSLPSDDKNLSESSRKIVSDFEDLSFMLSKVLMFPLKSDE